MRRAGLAGLTLVVLCGILAVGAVVGWKAVSRPAPSPLGGDETDEPTCVEDIARGDVLDTTEVTVSVFNAGRRSGLASQTRAELTARGFLPGDVGNAPGKVDDVTFVRVLAPRKKDPAALLVARQFGRGTLVQPYDDDLGPGVDIIVGDKFRGLAKAPKKLTAAVPGSGC